MSATAAHLTVPRTARYYMLGEPTEQVRQVWFVLHGYGQLAEYFVKYFEPIAGPTRLFIAPEGLSRFYLDGQYARVGASWMTREDRAHEIADQQTYLNALYDLIMLELDPNVMVNVLGFSQGTATAVRWVEAGHPRCDNLILWGGSFPLDGKPSTEHHRALTRKEVIMAFGSTDAITTPERIAAHRAELDAAGVLYEMVAYEGGHTIPEEAIVALAAQLEREALARS
jgi:predicted esterase